MEAFIVQVCIYIYMFISIHMLYIYINIHICISIYYLYIYMCRVIGQEHEYLFIESFAGAAVASNQVRAVYPVRQTASMDILYSSSFDVTKSSGILHACAFGKIVLSTFFCAQGPWFLRNAGFCAQDPWRTPGLGLDLVQHASAEGSKSSASI